MGCGGSRADAIEPRYYESWTRETESTWLTYTDSDASPSNATPDSGPEAGGLHAEGNLDTDTKRRTPCEDRGRGWSDAFTNQGTPRIASSHQKPGERHRTGSLSRRLQKEPTLPTSSFQTSSLQNCGLEDGVPSNSVPRSTAPSGISNPEKKMSCGTQCPNPQGLSSGPLTQKQNGFRTTEAKRDAKRTSGKEVTINVADSIRQVDRSRRITKNCVN
ncbi:brain and acute leukemia cytoplasmic protein isoform X1 [Balaenoptera acutorostrata]|uniref:Brain and acute leukemia cytoplasmic protein isoform X1 n=1 Tax=Balaenoptera acutorostrata TaxID=9767 RepID=A0ABM3SCT5_BALAC|nr:brain and acute leukemia cytoplasmic protein isoform X1 [Balaenoptera acutorostrata]